jgi:hypothetical protein
MRVCLNHYVGVPSSNDENLNSMVELAIENELQILKLYLNNILNKKTFLLWSSIWTQVTLKGLYKHHMQLVCLGSIGSMVMQWI